MRSRACRCPAPSDRSTPPSPSRSPFTSACASEARAPGRSAALALALRSPLSRRYPRFSGGGGWPRGEGLCTLHAPVPLAATDGSDANELGRQLARAGYLASDELALVAWLALKLERPLLVEGPAGVGKTDLARALSEALSRELVRLQCYEGLDEARALYEWDYAKQMLYTQLLRESVSSQTAGAATLTEAADRLAGADTAFFSRRFLIERPLLRALSSEAPVVMLVDEIDRADPEFEAFLLEVLAERQATIPELGTIRARSAPLPPDQQRHPGHERRPASPLLARVRRLSAAVARAGDPRASRPRVGKASRRAADGVRARRSGAGSAEGAVDCRDDRLGPLAGAARRRRARRVARPLDPRSLAQVRGRPREGGAHAHKGHSPALGNAVHLRERPRLGRG